MKKFLALCAIEKDGTYSMRGPIDEYWHTFLVFTELYSQFCDSIASRFIHHIPNSEDPVTPKYSLSKGKDEKHENIAKLRRGYTKFLNDYEQIFSQIPPVHLWPRTSEDYEEFAGAGCVCGCGCRCIA
jgi:hypothetical protein